MDHVQLWTVDRSMVAYEKHRELLEAIGVGQSPAKVLAAVKKPAWRSLAKVLQSELIPADVLKRLDAATSLTIIPHGWLWYVLFELFPDSQVNPSQPWLARHSISYAPTLGIAIQSFAETSAATRTLGVTRSGFFVADKDVDSSLAKNIIDSANDMQHIDVHAKVHDSRWSRLQFDRVWVAADTTLEYGTPFALMAYGASGATSLGQWLQLPLASPTQLVLIGNEIPALVRKDGEGLELFRLSCCLAAIGNRSALVNRWSPRGESSQLLVKNFLERSNEISAAQAWRQSVLSLWETPLQYSTEPILGTLKKDYFQEEFYGSHPIFWSGTMAIGNTQPAKSP